MSVTPAHLIGPEHSTDTAALPLVPSPAAHGLSVALALVVASAAGLTLIVPDVLHGPAAMNGSARGTAAVMLVAGVPVLLAGQLATRRRIARGVPVWLGAVAYLLYNAFMLIFGTPFNALFLLYVASLSLALWTLVAALHVLNVPGLISGSGPAAPRRAIAVFAGAVAVLNAAAWLRGIVPALAEGADPTVLQGTGLTTIPTYVQDLAVWLPLMGVAATWLWRGLAWGSLVVAAMLVQWVLEAVTISVDQYLGSTADPTSPVVSAAMSPAFGLFAIVLLVPTVALLRRM